MGVVLLGVEEVEQRGRREEEAVLEGGQEVGVLGDKWMCRISGQNIQYLHQPRAKGRIQTRASFRRNPVAPWPPAPSYIGHRLQPAHCCRPSSHFDGVSTVEGAHREHALKAAKCQGDMTCSLDAGGLVAGPARSTLGAELSSPPISWFKQYASCQDLIRNVKNVNLRKLAQAAHCESLVYEGRYRLDQITKYIGPSLLALVVTYSELVVRCF